MDAFDDTMPVQYGDGNRGSDPCGFIDLSIERGANLKAIWATLSQLHAAFCLSKLDCHGPSAPAIPTSF